MLLTIEVWWACDELPKASFQPAKTFDAGEIAGKLSLRLDEESGVLIERFTERYNAAAIDVAEDWTP